VRPWVAILTFTSLLLSGEPAFGASADWSRVQSIPAGSLVRAHGFDGAEKKGTLQSVDDTALHLNLPGGQRTDLPRAEVARVELYKPSRRLVKALIGGGIGFAAGAVGAFATCPSCVGEQSSADFNARMVGGMLIGAGFGAGLGAGLASSYQTVYKAKRR
jgi:hypothetical protein